MCSHFIVALGVPQLRRVLSKIGYVAAYGNESPYNFATKGLKR